MAGSFRTRTPEAIVYLGYNIRARSFRPNILPIYRHLHILLPLMGGRIDNFELKFLTNFGNNVNFPIRT